MEKERTDGKPSESGVALVMALLITLAMLLLIVALSNLYQTGYRANTINKEFSTVYEAAQAGVEHSSGVVNSFLSGATPTTIGNVGSISPDPSTLADIATTCSTPTSTITANSADGKFTIVAQVKCLGARPIPGYGGTLRFPPPPGAVASGSGGMATKYLFYSESAQAKEASNPDNIGQTDAVYRAMQ